MALNRRRVTRWVLALGALLVAALLLDAGLLWRDVQRNVAIAAAATPPPDGAVVPHLQFARAHALAASGAADAALDAYRALQSHPTLGQAARFNGANLLLRQAMELRAGNEPGKALPLIELAKEQYRALLRQDPQHWEARYNLERAQRLLPDPVDDDLQTTAAPQERERAATTMRAQSLGLP